MAAIQPRETPLSEQGSPGFSQLASGRDHFIRKDGDLPSAETSFSAQKTRHDRCARETHASSTPRLTLDRLFRHDTSLGQTTFDRRLESFLCINVLSPHRSRYGFRTYAARWIGKMLFRQTDDKPLHSRSDIGSHTASRVTQVRLR